MSILLVLGAALIGSVAGYFAMTRFLLRYKRAGLVAALVVAAVLATVATNCTQLLLDSGLPFGAVDSIEAASYFVFGFSASAGWVALKPSRTRWLLLLLVPIALLEPLRWALAFMRWSIRYLTT